MKDIKSYISAKTLVYIFAAIGLLGYILYVFFSSSDKTKEKDSLGMAVPRDGKILVQNEKPQGKDFFEGYKQRGKDRAALDLSRFSSSHADRKSSESDSLSNELNIQIQETDDEDIEVIQKTLRKIESQEQQPPVTISKPARQIPQQPKITIQEKQDTVAIQPKDAMAKEPKVRRRNRFYEGKLEQTRGNTFACDVHGEQEIMNGSRLKIRLMDEYVTPEGVTLPVGTTLWGVCSLTKERMDVSVKSVLVGKDLIDLNFIAYDIDGLQGINLPNNVKAEIAKRLKQQALQEAPTDEAIGGNGVLEKGVKAIANTTKSLLSKKQGEIKITVKSGYKLVLKPIQK